MEVVTANETLKDGKSVKQMLIDTYAENQKTIEGKRPPITIGEEERSAVQDIKKGRKYNTSFHAQMFVMAMRAFKQRRGDILNWMQTFTIVAIAILSGLLWFQMDMKGNQPPLSSPPPPRAICFFVFVSFSFHSFVL